MGRNRVMAGHHYKLQQQHWRISQSLKLIEHVHVEGIILVPGSGLVTSSCSTVMASELAQHNYSLLADRPSPQLTGMMSLYPLSRTGKRSSTSMYPIQSKTNKWKCKNRK